MFETKQKLVIVSDEKTKKFGDYLMQLISSNDDMEENVIGVKDGTVKAVHISDKEYVKTKATITSDEKILFIGNNKLTKNECAFIDIKFNEYGMSYGWLGSRALLTVDKKMLDKERYNCFLTLGDRYKKQFEYKSVKTSEKIGIATGFLTFIPVAWAGAATFAILKKSKLEKEIQDQQYALLVSIFYMDALKKFLEG